MAYSLGQKLVPELKRLVAALADQDGQVDEVLEDIADLAAEEGLEQLAELADYLLILNDLGGEAQVREDIAAWLDVLATIDETNANAVSQQLSLLYAKLRADIKQLADLDIGEDLLDRLYSFLAPTQQSAPASEAREKHAAEQGLGPLDHETTAGMAAIVEDAVPDVGGSCSADASAVAPEPEARSSSELAPEKTVSLLHTKEGINPRLVDAFNQETLPQIDSLVERLANQTPGQWPEHDALVRLPHTIKGAAAVIGLGPLAALAEALENALDNMPDTGPSLQQQSLLRKAAQQLEALANAWKEKVPFSIQALQAVVQQLREAFQENATVTESPQSAQDPMESMWLEPKPDLDPRLRDSFFLETPDQVMELAQLLQLASSRDTEDIDINAAMRLAHTVKGSANLAGLMMLQDLAHLLEDLLQALGEHGGLEEHKELLSEAGDLLSLIGEALESRSQQIEAPVAELASRLWKAVDQVTVGGGDRQDDAEDVDHGAAESVADDAFALLAWAEDAPEAQVDAFFEQAPDEMKELAAILAEGGSLEAGQIKAFVESALQIKQSAASIGLDAIARLFAAMVSFVARFSAGPPSSADRDLIARASAALLNLSGALAGENDPDPAIQDLSMALEKAARTPLSTRPEKPAASSVAGEQVIRIPLASLNQLLSQVGELSSNNTLMRNSLEKVTHLLQSLLQKGAHARELLQELSLLVETGNLGTSLAATSMSEMDPLEMDQYNALHSQTSTFAEALTDTLVLQRQANVELEHARGFVGVQERLSREISEIVLAARMVSVGSLIPRMERIVREAGRATGKKVRLRVQGEHLLLDTNVLNVIRDPLMHLLRNAVDHGIEPADVRRAKGKPEEGDIQLNFIHKGARILIQVIDDGAGFSFAAISEAAKRQHIDVSRLDQQELLQLLTQPGFTTRKKVSSLSGRGVGLDVVRTAVETVKGSLRLSQSEAGGSQFEMLVPITLVSVPSLFVEVSGQIMVLPSENVEQILYAEPEQVQALGNGWSYLHEGRPYVLRSLDNILGLREDSAASFAGGGVVLLLRIGGRARAIYVDSVLERREVIVQPLSKWLGSVQGVIGACVLADGGVGAVLDLDTLLTGNVHGSSPVFTPADGALESRQSARSKTIMVVDDSLSAREAAAIVLERAGYDVVTAIDGFDAIRKMEQAIPALALVDMEMPNMNGIELTRHIRTTGELSDLPVLMLTSRSSSKHREMALAAGVDAYVTKPFDEGELLKIIDKHIRERSQLATEVYS